MESTIQIPAESDQMMKYSSECINRDSISTHISAAITEI